MGLRRKKPFRLDTTGWSAKRREKVSRMALQGFAFEVRMRQADRWSFHSMTPEPCPYEELIRTLRTTADCRIVGHGPFTGHREGRKTWSLRIYLRTEADLFHLRMLTADNEVFRVYALHAPESE